MDLYYGNPLRQTVGPIYEYDDYGNRKIKENLSSADSITYLIKNRKTDPDSSAYVSLTIGNGIIADSPDIGYLLIYASSSVMKAVPIKKLYRGIRIVESGVGTNIELTEDGYLAETDKYVEPIIQGA